MSISPAKALLSLVLAGHVVACKNDGPPPAVTPAVPVVSVPVASVSAPAAASPAEDAAVVETKPAAKAEPPAPPPVTCKTNDDCWFDDARKPIARPAKLRGRRIAPCKNGEHVPSCDDGACVVRAYKC